MTYGDWDKSYDLLSKWLRVVQEFNPSSWVKFISTSIGYPPLAAFDCAFWVVAPSIEGFKHCRSIISIDATFMYKKYQEKLMIATAVNGNNQIFSLVFAIVDKESIDTWGWFLAYFRCCITSRPGICLISDRHSHILSALQNKHLSWQPLDAHHVYCLRHIASNFNTRFQDSRLRALVKIIRMQT